MESIKTIQYDVRNRITFPNGKKWDNNGFAILEKKKNDPVFGLSFYGVQQTKNDNGIIYDNQKSYVLNIKKKEYEEYYGDKNCLSSPGGQMIYSKFFNLDQQYDSINIKSTDNHFEINFFKLKNQYHRKVILEKKTMLIQSVLTEVILEDGPFIKKYDFSNFIINQNVSTSISKELSNLENFGLAPEEIFPKSPLLNKPLPEINLKSITENNNVNINLKGKVILIDFWEYWCGWCIKSFPEVQRISKKHEGELVVYGIATDRIDIAKKTLAKSKVTYTNLIGDKELLESFKVNSFPHYFIIDKNGIVVKEYFGFNEQIEEDIKKLVKQ